MKIFATPPAVNGDIFRHNVEFISHEDVKKFCNDLIINNPRFNSLEIRSCKLPADFVTILIDALQKTKTISALTFFANNLGDNGAASFAKLVAQRTDIKKLYLAFNDVTAEGVKTIAQTLNNSSLTELYLNENLIGDKGAPHLAVIIKQNQLLEKVQFGNNNLSKTGFLTVVEALKGHPSLKKIDLTILQCDLDDDCKKALTDAIQSTAGRLDVIVSYEGVAYSFVDIEKIERHLAQTQQRP